MIHFQNSIFHLLTLPLLVYGFIVSSWGWGQWLHVLLNKQKTQETPLCILAGFVHMCLVPYILWVLKVPLSISLGCTASIGLISAFYYRYFKAWPWDYHLGIVLLGLSAWVIDYSPFMDDEFNFWATSPLRMVLEGTLLPKESGCWDTYTPFSHIWGMYFQFLIVFKTFAGDTGIYISRATIWFTLIYAMKNSVSKRLDAQLVMVLVAYAMTTFYRRKGYHSLVIENIMYPLMTYVFLLAKQFIDSKNPNPFQKYTLGLSVLGGYMFKKSVVPLFASLGFWVWGKVTVRSALIFVVAALGVMLSWYTSCRGHAELWQYTFQDAWWYNERATMVYKALYERAVEFWPNWLLLASGLYFLNDQKRLRNGVFVFIILYFVGLVLLYLQSFNGEEASRLASFKRYLTVFIVPTVLVGVYSILEKYKGLSMSLPKRVGQSLKILRDEKGVRVLTTFILLVTVLCPLYSYARGDQTPIRQVRDAFFNSPEKEIMVYHDKSSMYSQQLSYYARFFKIWGKTLNHQENGHQK